MTYKEEDVVSYSHSRCREAESSYYVVFSASETYCTTVQDMQCCVVLPSYGCGIIYKALCSHKVCGLPNISDKTLLAFRNKNVCPHSSSTTKSISD